MLQRIPNLPPGVDGLQAIGKITKDDYDRVVTPLLDEARRDGRRLRLLYHFGPEFEGFTPGGVWEDAWVGLHALRRFDGCAIVTDLGWLRESARFVGFLMPCPVRVFGNAALGEAAAWLASLPQGPSIVHRLLPDQGVVVVEVTQALRAQDFDALAATADAWFDAHGPLRGVVIHARDFPGWENVGSLLRHIRFVRDHHRKVRRIALAADSKLAPLVPKLADHFAQAEVRHFRYDDVDAAIAWAGGNGGQTTSPGAAAPA